ncbi:MAG: ATP-dependent helicase [Phycisphaerales bacterium]
MTHDHLAQLNDEQRRAVTSTSGPLIVLAGPGTGKTTVITRRVAHLILEHGAEPESVLALTFTNKAAEEMRRRLGELLGGAGRADRVRAMTFHSFGLFLIRRFADMIGWPAEPTIIDSSRMRSLMRRLIDETGVGANRYLYDPYAIAPEALRFIAEASDHAISPARALEHADAWQRDYERRAATLEDEARVAEKAELDLFREYAELHRAFDEACLERRWATFSDLQSRPLRMLELDPRIRAIVRTEIRHIVIDEFQDVNRAQIELLKQVAPTDGDVCVVGDDDQSIYAFRGSHQAAFKHFAQHWSAATIELTKNYRSSSVVLDAANRIIQKVDDRFSADKRTIAAGDAKDDCVPVEGITYEGTDGAGPVIGRVILDSVGAGDRSWRDFAVLVRSGTDLARIQSSLQAMEIPVEAPERDDPFEHDEVQDVMSWLRILDDPCDTPRLTRILARPPYDLPIHTLSSWYRECAQASAAARDAGHDAEADRPPLERLVEWRRTPAVERFATDYEALSTVALTEPIDHLVRAVIRRSGLVTLDPIDDEAHQVRVQRLGALLTFVTERIDGLDEPRGLREFLRYFDDLDEADRTIGRTAESRLDSGVDSQGRDAVRILTAHGSKGLEFDTVFLPRINKNHGYPNLRSDRDRDYLPEALRDGEASSKENEERRVFFVAMTRAKRRLVLLSQSRVRVGAGNRCHPSVFWDETLVEHGGAYETVVRSASEVAAGSEAPPSACAITAAPRQTVRQRELSLVRREIFAALHALRRPDLDPAEFEAQTETVRRLAMRVPLLAAEDESQLDRLIDAAREPDRPALREFADRLQMDEPFHPGIEPPRPPLRLTYSDIATYLRCPRCYWLARVARIPEPGTPASTFGSIIHRSLEFFYKAVRDHAAGITSGPAPGVDDLVRIGRDAYEQMRPASLAQTTRFWSRIEAALRQYHERLHDESANPVEVELDVSFDYRRRDHAHRIVVRIDRVDFDGRYRLVDYKTGRPKKELLEPKSGDLQMGVYALALRHWLEEEVVDGVAEYWLIATGERGTVDLAKLKLDKVEEKIGEVIDGILAGDWTVGRQCSGRCESLGGLLSDWEEREGDDSEEEGD